MLTEKMKAYAAARVSGKNQTQSAILAGYGEQSAKQTGSKLEKNVEIRAEILRLREEKAGITPEQKPEVNSDPIKFMAELMSDVREDPKLRLEAAKALASYTVAKPGEKGKKQEQQERAGKASGKFGVPTPPSLKAVK